MNVTIQIILLSIVSICLELYTVPLQTFERHNYG
jgi:hypothetical protein